MAILEAEKAEFWKRRPMMSGTGTGPYIYGSVVVTIKI